MSGAWTGMVLCLQGYATIPWKHYLETLCQPSFLISKPRLGLDRVSKRKQNEGQSRQVTRRAPKCRSSCHQARCTVVWDCWPQWGWRVPEPQTSRRALSRHHLDTHTCPHYVRHKKE